MSIIKVKDIEDALIAAIKAGMSYIKYCETYQGEIEEEKIVQAAMNFPAVLIYLEANKISDRAWPLKWQQPTFTLFVCEKNLRGKKQAAQGDIRSPGIYQMLDDLFDTIYQKTFDLDIDPFDIPGDAVDKAVIVSSGIMVYAQQYFTKARKN